MNENEKLNSMIKNFQSEHERVGRNMNLELEKFSSETQHLKTTIMKYEENINRLNREN